MPSDERDRQFERALQRHLRADASEAACPDAEILAAYHERTLILEELTKWKEHIVSCVRCQETLALLEQTSAVGFGNWQEQAVAHPETFLAAAAPSTSVRPSAKLSDVVALQERVLPERRRPTAPRANSWRWLGAAGALAAGLILFVAVRENRRDYPERAKSEMAQNMAVPPPPPSSPTIEQLSKSANETAALNSQEEEAPPTSALRDLQNSSRMERAMIAPQTAGTPAPAKPRASKPAPPILQGTDKFESAAVEPKGTEASAQAHKAQAAGGGAAQNSGQGFGNAPLPQQASPARAPVASATTGDNAVPRKSAQDSAKQNAEAGSTREPVEETGEAGTVSRESSEALATKLTSQLQPSVNGRVLMQVAQSNPHVIVAPTGVHAWRVGPAGLIEVTSDSGLKWKTQDSTVRVDLTAGSAPTEKVCWVVGKAGTILLTEDGGKHWKRVTSPLIEDLGRVHAVDGKHASIWNIGNQKNLETADGGLTWAPVANE